jgi:hypothetical protein
MTLQDIWIDFKIISMLGPTRKLYINDDALALEPISLFSPIKRWLNNSNRRCVITRIKQRVEELETYFKKKDYEDKEWVRVEIIKLIDPVKEGLSNLRETYAEDSQMAANIELIIARLEFVRYLDEKKV